MIYLIQEHFVLYEDIEKLKKLGLGKGGSLRKCNCCKR